MKWGRAGSSESWDCAHRAQGDGGQESSSTRALGHPRCDHHAAPTDSGRKGHMGGDGAGETWGKIPKRPFLPASRGAGGRQVPGPLLWLCRSELPTSDLRLVWSEATPNQKGENRTLWKSTRSEGREGGAGGPSLTDNF